ncbi:hypothetical protein PV08_04940 [Exophiala spinifera]|uniref:BolA protein n=1 Tax=Exophiala spinifera TaxID=91928 RepID=A0A0D2BGH9_9EURO|nr:uncharacterized protein PV08_04940 [Exophiala spinifera]KIW17745.1 hypothetical protein PV08_04940 [Exophiala spinifera]
MAGSTSKETHFYSASQVRTGFYLVTILYTLIFSFLPVPSVEITSEVFTSKPQPARHRMVYALLKGEMEAQGGIHALQLRTKTPEEEGRISNNTSTNTTPS